MTEECRRAAQGNSQGLLAPIAAQYVAMCVYIFAHPCVYLLANSGARYKKCLALQKTRRESALRRKLVSALCLPKGVIRHANFDCVAEFEYHTHESSALTFYGFRKGM